jgi:hypothetical protein
VPHAIHFAHAINRPQLSLPGRGAISKRNLQIGHEISLKVLMKKPATNADAECRLRSLRTESNIKDSPSKRYWSALRQLIKDLYQGTLLDMPQPYR